MPLFLTRPTVAPALFSPQVQTIILPLIAWHGLLDMNMPKQLPIQMRQMAVDGFTLNPTRVPPRFRTREKWRIYVRVRILTLFMGPSLQMAPGLLPEIIPSPMLRWEAETSWSSRFLHLAEAVLCPTIRLTPRVAWC